MLDDGRVTLDPREGERISGSGGERAVVAVAAIALLGGLFIVAGNVIGSLVGDPVAAASASAEPTARPRRTPGPSPTPRPLREFTLSPGTPSSPRVDQMSFSGFIEARQGLVLRDRAAADGTDIGLLAEGQLAYAEERGVGGDWLYVTTRNVSGWVDTGGQGDGSAVARIEQVPPPTADVLALVSSGEDFVAPMWRSTPDNLFAAGILSSPDGITWHETTFEPAEVWSTFVAWGPAGWLGVSVRESPSGGTDTWVSRLDGDLWRPVGAFGVVNNFYPEQLVGSDLGYLYVAQNGALGGEDAHSVWFSSDGVTWRESAPLGLNAEGWNPLRLAAVPGGFYAWSPYGATAAAFSANGRSWTLVEGGPRSETMQLVGMGSGLVAIDVGLGSDAVRVWDGTIDGEIVRWRHAATADSAFAGAGVSSLIGDGQTQAIALGWDLETDTPMTWIRSGESWRREPLPAEFGGIPRLGAVAGDSAVIVGYRPSLQGANPTMWHRSAGGTWSAETVPVLAVPELTAADCGEPFRDPLANLYLDRSVAVTCQSDAPLTFTAWADICSNCAGPFVETPGESFLNGGRNFVEVGVAEGVAWTQTVVLDPALVTDVELSASAPIGWVEMTGHFDDPRAVDCGWAPDPMDYSYYLGQADAVRNCRMQFVVTDLTSVEAP
jgi:hypothetical protein